MYFWAEINCGSPGILPHGWLEGSRTTLHAVVTFRCEDGMTFSGPSYRTICQVPPLYSQQSYQLSILNTFNFQSIIFSPLKF